MEPADAQPTCKSVEEEEQWARHDLQKEGQKERGLMYRHLLEMV